MDLNNTSLNENLTRGVPEIVILSLIMCVIIILAISGNIAVIVAILTNHRLKEELSNILVINLSITDLSSSILVMLPSLISLASDKWLLGPGMCDFVCMANYCFIIVSMMTLSFISIDRYFAVVHSMRYHVLINKQRILMMIAYAWFQGAVFAVIPVVFRWVEFDYWEAVCAIQWHREREQALYYVITAFLVCFLLPGIVLIVCYTKVLKTAKAKMEAQELQMQGLRTSTKYSTSSKAMYGLLVVVVAFFLCMTPFSTTKLYKVATSVDSSIPGYVNLMSSIIAYISSAVNPLLYGIFRKDFRVAYKNLLRKFIARNSIVPRTNNPEWHLSEIS